MHPPQLERKLGLWVCISIVAGAVIGSGIFMKPAAMASQTDSGILLLIVWVVAGMVSMIGAMISAEIGSILPLTGGQYVYFRHMYGDFFAFLYGWASFIVINTVAIGAIAFVFAQFTNYFIELPRFSSPTETAFAINIPYIGSVFPLQHAGVKVLAVALIVVITYINVKSVKAGGQAQLLFTVLKVVALLFVIFILFAGKGSIKNLYSMSSTFDSSPWHIVTACIAACSGALAAYDGWNNLGFVAGEIKNPRKNIPRGLIAGLGICIIMYVAANEAYLFALPIDDMKTSKLVAADAVLAGTGILGAGLVSGLVIISTAGAVNGNVLPCARVIFAMAQEKNFFAQFGHVHAKYHTPANALWLQATWSSLFVFTGSFDLLTDLFVFITWIFYGFAAYGIFILRKKIKTERPYKMWGYPLLPWVFIAFALLYFTITIYNDINNYVSGRTPVVYSMLGLLLTSAGIPLYFYFRSRRLRSVTEDERTF